MGAWSSTLPFSGPKKALTVTRLNDGSSKANDLHDNYFATQVFRGLRLGNDRQGNAASKIVLYSADEIVMHDGYRLGGWNNLTADITVSGAGGLDTGSEASSMWYEVLAIAKDDNTKNIMLHQARRAVSTLQAATPSSVKLRDTSTNTKLAQGIQWTTVGPIWYVDITLQQVGTVSGGLPAVWLTVEADSSGSPSGTPLTTSDKVGANLIPTTAGAIRFFFRDGWTPSASTQNHLVLQGDFTISASNYVNWFGDTSNSYANGVAKIYNGSTWSASGTVLDFQFTAAVSVESAPTMPSGYTRRARIGFVYNNGSSNLDWMFAVDRYVHQGQVGLGTFTNTFHVLGNFTPYVPPVPVQADFGVANSAAGNFVQLAPPDNPLTGQTTGHVAYATVANSAALSNMLRAFLEAQAAYFLTNAGTAQVFTSGYQW